MNPAGYHWAASVGPTNGYRSATIDGHVAGSEHARDIPVRTGAAGSTDTTSNWTIEVNDGRWRALVDLLLPPGEIALAPREDYAVRRPLPDPQQSRPA